MSRGTLDPASLLWISLTRLSLSLAGFPKTILLSIVIPYAVRNPEDFSSVWALSISLAATPEIDFSFSSSGYLDVSVPRVPFITLCVHVMITDLRQLGFPIQKSVGQKIFAPRHSLSQLITSFIGS